MKKVSLKQLRMLNFKGIRELTIFFEGTTNITGANRAGKSTVFDAFTWNLWGKDQFDRKDHEIKTLDSTNEAIHNLNHEVEAVFDVNGREEKTKRIYKEIWTKKRGEPRATFTGHETVYFWNDVPCKASEYQAKISEIISEGMFKLITNPHFFNALPWEKRRSCLMDMAGTITNQQIFDKIATPANDYGGLINVLNSGKTAADYKKQIAVRKTKIKKELEEIPTRINEAERNMPDSADWDGIAQLIEEKKLAIQRIEDSLSDAATAQAASQKEIMSKQSELHTLRTQLQNIRFSIKTDIQNTLNESSGQLTQAENAVRNMERSITATEVEIRQNMHSTDYYTKEIENKGLTLDACRNAWVEINAEVFAFGDTNCICPTCKQDLPQEDIEEQKAALLQNFNDSVANRKGEKHREADKLKNDIAALSANLGELSSKILSLQKDLATYQEELPRLKTKYATAKLVHGNKSSFDIEAAVDEKLGKDAIAIERRRQIAAIETELSVTGQSSDTSELKSQKSALQIEIDGLRRQLAVKETIDKTNLRIRDLRHEEETLSQELAGQEQQEFEIEKYLKAQMDILETRINDRFRLVKFKLFDRQINGGEVECCECLINGVPYSAANTESRINAGLDIINVLCAHYQVSAPVFIDNRESVSEIIPTESQIINLIVNPAFKTLQVVAA